MSSGGSSGRGWQSGSSASRYASAARGSVVAPTWKNAALASVLAVFVASAFMAPYYQAEAMKRDPEATRRLQTSAISGARDVTFDELDKRQQHEQKQQ